MSKNKVVTKHDDFAKQLDLIRLGRTLLGGTDTMRAAGLKYMPKRKAEDEADYRARLEQSVLVNYYKDTIEYLIGQVFSKPVDYQKGVEGQTAKYNEEFFNTFKENVNAAGDNLTTFASQFMHNGINDGVTFLLVDYPNVRTFRDTDGTLKYKKPDGSIGIKNQVADKAHNWQPYFINIKADQVLDAWVVTENGHRVLKHFRYEEFEEVDNPGHPYQRKTLWRVRSFYPGSWQVHESLDGEDFHLTDEGQTSLSSIPIFWFMPGTPFGPTLAAYPPLADLAEMNRVHWNAYNDHREMMKWGRSPMWLGTNLVNDKMESLPMGPSRIISAVVNSDMHVPDLRSVGIDSASVQWSLEDLERIVEIMESYGLQVALAKTGATATAITTAYGAADSKLKKWCMLLIDVLENALKAVSAYQGETDGPAVFVNTTFRQVFDAGRSSFLKSARDSKEISRRNFLESTKAMGLYYDDMDVAEEEKLLKEEEQAEADKFRPALQDYSPGFGEKNNAREGAAGE